MALNAEGTFASRFSSEWQNLHAEVAAIDVQLAKLPGIPFRGNAGTRCFMRFFEGNAISATLEMDMTIRLQWPETHPVDLVALVPARKIDIDGLDPNHGFPEDFTVSLILPDNGRKSIATFRSTSKHPVHHGHPFVITLPEASLATGMEIHVTRVRAPRHGVRHLGIVALSEILCFSGEDNIAPGARVTVDGNATLNPSAFWNDGLLVDGILPLGLPELPRKNATEDEDWPIGWISHAQSWPKKPMNVTLDLGESRQIDGLRLYPTIMPSVDDFPGFGIPLHFKLLGGNDPKIDGASLLLDRSRIATGEQGHNFHYFRFPKATVRYVHLNATHLWKPFEEDPAFLGFSEIELLHGYTVISRGAAVTVPERNERVIAHVGQILIPEALTDGRGPQGDLSPIRQWIEMLGERLALETRRHHANQRMMALEIKWQHGTLITSISVGALAFLLVLIQRVRHSRHLRETRRSIANDLHDDVGSNLGSIQMLSSLACDKSNNRDELNTIRKVAAETITSVRDIVWLLQPTSSEQVRIVDHLRESAAALLDPLAWSLDSDFYDWRLNDQERRHLILFFREALHNIRHAKPSKVEIHLNHNRGWFLLTISDNGCGIEESKLADSSTLRALRQRAERLDGTLDVKSDLDRGTIISLRFKPRASGSAKAPIHKLD